ncbi:MAG: thioether cross-link-forming SCIFF peptide maturase [Dethiobacteria bacterium]|jgi:uncharacterized protein
MGDVHSFRYKDLYLVLDVESNCLHAVDELAFEAIDLLNKGLSWSQCCQSLAKYYAEADVENVLTELKTLVEKGMLFSKKMSEIDGEEKLVKALCLHVAHACNLRCQYCFADAGSFGEDQFLMTLEVGQKAIDFLLEASGERRHCEVDFFGGEPLLNFDAVKKLTRYGYQKARKKGKIIQFTLTTNAVLMNEEAVHFLKANNFQVILSLDGRPEVHDTMRYDGRGRGSHAAALSGVRRFLDGSVENNYYIRGTFTAQNLDFSNDIRYLVEQGFKRISLEPVVAPPDQSYALKEEHLARLKKEYEMVADLYLQKAQEDQPFEFFHFNIDLERGPCLVKRLSGCGAGKEYLAITPHGEIYPCHQFVGQRQFLMGNVLLENSFRFLPESSFPAAGPLVGECRQCWARYHCGGGCRANAYFVNGDLKRPYALGCSLQKKRLECALYIKAKRHLEAEDQ